MQTININGTNYTVKFSFRAIKNFEDIAKKPITQCVTTWDNLLFFYAALKAANKNFEIDFEAFTDYLDEHPELLVQFQTADILNSDTPASQPPPAKKKYSRKQIFTLWMLLLFASVLPVLVPVISIIAWILTSFWLLANLIKPVGSKPAP